MRGMMERTIEFIKDIVVTFMVVQVGTTFEVRPRLTAYPHSMKVDHAPTEEEIAEHFMSNPALHGYQANTATATGRLLANLTR
jgi:hypothetical protein